MKHIKYSIFALMCLTTCTSLTDTSTGTDEFEKNIYIWSGTLGEAMNLVHTRYYQEVDAQKAMIKAINSFVALDPHSQLLDPDAYKQILETTQGEFSGIGIVIDNLKEPDDEFLRIIDTIPAGPSDKAGILPGDTIVQIENESLRGMTVEEAVAKLKGKKGTTVHIKVARKGTSKLIPFDIVRDTVEVQQASCYYFSDHNMYYVALTMFTENSMEQIKSLLQKSQQNHSKGLILDLRNNSGGLLDSVVDIAGLFVPKNSLVVVTKDKNKKIIDEYRTTTAPVYSKPIPIFILVNNYTASAAEILAGTLQYYSENPPKGSPLFNVLLVGTPTFGKGSVQEVIPMSNDTALKMTTALYYLADDETIQGKGITPDFEIEAMRPLSNETKWFNEFFGRESALKNSIKTDTAEKNNDTKKAEKKDEDKTWQERKQEQLSNDYQLLNTIRLIELLDCARHAQPEKLSTRSKTVEYLKKAYNPHGSIKMEEIKI